MVDDELTFFRPIWDHFDGESFQDLVVDLLCAEGYRVEPSGVGPDGGVDAFAIQDIHYGYNNPEAFTWAVQCKFTAANRTISPRDVGEILNVASDERFGARKLKGYFLVTNGRLSTNMMSQLRGSNDRIPGFRTTYLDRSKLHNLIGKYPTVFKKYFWDRIEKAEVAKDERVGEDPTLLLEKMVASEHVCEAEISAFFQSHPRLLSQAFGTQGEAISQVRLGHHYIADFLLRPHGNDPWVVVELRSPRYKLVAGRRQGLSAPVFEAVEQLRAFQRFFDDPQSRAMLMTASGLDICRPRLALVISRDYGEMPRDSISNFRERFSGIEMLTYKDLLDRIRVPIS